jgi:hypothetical protein|tara:strand:+ start:471 stop:593 length:123 start_codon:yes stop_codon:yes gene_type:complete
VKNGRKILHVVSNEEDLAMKGLLAMSNDKNNESDDEEVGF